MEEATADSPDDAAEPTADRDLSSLARLLHYAMCEADALGQGAAVALIDAAIFSLNAEDPAPATGSVDEAASDEDRPRMPLERPLRSYSRKFC